MVAMNDARDQELEDHIELDSRLEELKRTWPWIEGIADSLHLKQELRYAIHLCIEEALANTVLHGYRNQPGNPILLRARATPGELTIRIEDRAAPFTPPADGARSDAPASLEDLTPGGNGIRLMRQFAGSLLYEPLASGNRLTISFFWPASDIA